MTRNITSEKRHGGLSYGQGFDQPINRRAKSAGVTPGPLTNLSGKASVSPFADYWFWPFSQPDVLRVMTGKLTKKTALK